MNLEESIQNSIENLRELKEGLNFFNDKPFIYELCDENDEINREQPAKWAVFPTFDQEAHSEGIYEILTIGVWKGVPDEYKPILVIHELREFETDSHEEARGYEMEFAKKFLSEEGFKRYSEWRKQYDPGVRAETGNFPKILG